MIVEHGHVSATVLQATPEENTWLHNYLVFSDPAARFSAAFQSGKWDGLHRMYSLVTNKFPAGLLPLVLKGATKALKTVNVVDNRQFTQAESKYQTTWLDPLREQPQAYQACLAAKRGIVWAPTGSGKSELMVALSYTVRCNWLIAVPAKDLLEQTRDRYFKRTGETAGRIGDGHWEPARVTVATFQTLYRRLQGKGKLKDECVKFLVAQGGLCLDECHVLPSDTFSKIPLRMPNAAYRLGFSGTPLARGDQRNILLVAHTGPIIYKVDAQKLIAAGVLSEPTIRFVPHDQNVAGFDWRSVYDNGVVNSPTRNQLVVDITLRSAKPALVIVKEVAQGRLLETALRAAGLRVEFVWGASATQGRKNAIERLVRGDTDAILASPIFDQGVDIPELVTVVIAGGGASTIRALQRLGRGMRVLPDGSKTACTLWDIADTGNKWLKKHAQARRQVYVSAGFRVVEGLLASHKT